MKQGILTDENIRESRDEEIIARIYSYMILGDKISPSSETLNKIYTPGTNYYVSIEKYLEKTSVTEMMETYSKVYADFTKIFASVNSTFSRWLFSSTDVKGKQKIFQALFLSIYKLRQSNHFIDDYRETANALKKIGDNEFKEITQDGLWTAEIRNNMIRRIISGISRMNVVQFAVFTALGALVWNAILAGLGYWLSLHVSPDMLFDKVEEYNRYLTWGGYALFGICVIYILWNAFRNKKAK